MKTPLGKYQNDYNYKLLVDTLVCFIYQGQITTSEIREAAIFACKNYNWIKIELDKQQ